MNTILNLLFSSVGAATLLGVLAWLARKYINEWVAGSVRNHFDREIEVLKSDLAAKQAQIVALREGALTSMVTRQSSLAARRQRAADDLWSAVQEWDQFGAAATSMGTFNFQEVSKRIETETKLQEVFSNIGQGLPDPNTIARQAHSTRPYLSDLAWALYTAYMAVFTTAYAKLQLLSRGIDGREFFQFAAVQEMLVTALPDMKRDIEASGHQGYHKWVETLRLRILEELRRTLAGQEENKDSVRQAAEIAAMVEGLERASEEATAKAKG